MVVCTANICRSVMAERFLRRDAAVLGIALELSSCGILFDDEPASDTVIDVLKERGLDATDHRSRKFVPEMLNDLDLVLTMERMHARELAVALGGASSRIHTLGGFVGWLADSADELDGPPIDRLATYAEGRRASDLLGSGADEVDDPHGRSKRIHRRTADRLELLSGGLLDGLYGPANTK
ncbi:MAG: protein-tyrosine phosphatase [Candidatus Aldehydirespiratoraceae bacterium]|jgi:protein-tyrosine phosphatase